MNKHKLLSWILVIFAVFQLQAKADASAFSAPIIRFLFHTVFLPQTIRMKKTQHDVDFYARVIDQDNNPVKGAKVCYSVSRYKVYGSRREESSAITDENGAFEIHKGKGARLRIDNISAVGYQWKAKEMYDEHTSFEYRTRNERHKPDPNSPVIFHLRRKDMPGTVLLQKGLVIELTSDMPEKWSGMDICEFSHFF